MSGQNSVMMKMVALYLSGNFKEVKDPLSACVLFTRWVAVGVWHEICSRYCVRTDQRVTNH
jgi:hypothetical protein